MDADQIIVLALWAVLCSIVCGLAVVALPSGRPAPDRARAAIPPPRAQARHASRAPVDTPPAGVRGLRPAAAHAPSTVAFDLPVARPYVPPIYIDGPRTAYGTLPSELPVIRVPQCSLCKDGVHVIGAACIICGALPVMPEVRS